MEYHGISWHMMLQWIWLSLDFCRDSVSLNIGYGLMDQKNGSYGCSSPISTVQQILTEDDMFSWLSTPLQGLEINLGTSVTHLSPLHSLHLVSMSLEL